MTYTYDELFAKTVPQKRAICRDLGCVGYSHAVKGELIDMILSANTAEEAEVPAAGTVTVRSGAMEKPLDSAVGSTVSAVLSELSDWLEVADGSNFLVNGTEVSGDFVLAAGDILEFVKPSGTKG